MPRKRKPYHRKTSTMDANRIYVIATEGACTEKIYFEGAFRRANIIMKVLPSKKGLGFNS